ncbi:MAG: 4-phosphoerythronate dehydrogenase [Bacteroidaceae bacterium]|nr:4-phosphoerythronate dehydrogenase [Bacteroidaceae bacterium]
MKIVLDDKIPYVSGPLQLLREALAARGETLEAVALGGSAIDAAVVRDADILLVRTRTRCDAALLEHSRVRLVVTATIGYDHLDTSWLDAAGIAWTNCPGCNATSVAQYVVACLTVLEQERGLCLADATVGVVGVGHVGKAVVAALHAAGVGRVLLNDPPRAEAEGCAAFVSLAELLAASDVVTLHTPLTLHGRHATYHLIGSEALRLLPRRDGGVVLVNAARGGVVDETALLRAMDAGTVGAAVIDTWEGEPAINGELLRRAFIATPHIAGYSADGKANATRMSFEAVAGYLGLQVAFDVQPPAQTNAYGTAASSGIAVAPTTAPAATLPRPGSILWHYDPRHDSTLLKRDASGFEWQRGHYPLRREA